MVVTTDTWVEVQLICAGLPIPPEDACERLTARLRALQSFDGTPESWPRMVVVDDWRFIHTKKPEALVNQLEWTVRARPEDVDPEWLERWMKAQLELVVSEAATVGLQA